MTISSGAIIHPTALIEDGAIIENNVTIGAYCHIGSNVKIASGTTLRSHCVVDGYTTLAENVSVYSFSSIGTSPQDLKYKGEETFLEIGSHTVIREHVTINTGTLQGGKYTRIGAHCLIMVGAHVAHDCQIQNNVILVNNATCGGHVHIGQGAVLGGLCAVHQFVRIGQNAMVGGMTGVERDVIPYGSVLGNRARLKGLNIIGLKRNNIPHKTIHTLREVYTALFSHNTVNTSLRSRAVDIAEKYQSLPEVLNITDFILSDSNRAFCMPQ